MGLVDLEFGQAVTDWPERTAAGAELLHVRVGAYVDTLDSFLAAHVRTGEPMPGCGPLVTMGPLKVISDGSLNTLTAWCCSPYDDGSTGAANISSEGLRAVMDAANRHRLEVAIHAIGDAAVDQALTAFESTGARGSIEHAQLIQHARRQADGGPRRTSERAAGPPARRPRPHRAAVARPHRALLRAAVAGRRGRRAGPGLRRPGLAARPVAGDLGGRPPQRRRARAVARRAVAHRRARRWPRSTDGLGTVAVGHPADLTLLDADPLAPGTSYDQAHGCAR